MYKPPKIGMRIIKTALSILITLVLTDVAARGIFGLLFSGDYLSVSIAVVACVVVMQDSIKGTLKASKDRIEATVIGIIIGSILMGLLMLLNREEWHNIQRFAFYFAASVGSVFVIYFCMLINGRGLSSLSVIVFISVLFAYTNDYPMLAVGMRLLETFIGVGVTIAVNLLICPPPLNFAKPKSKSVGSQKYSTRCVFCIKPKDVDNRCENCQEDEFLIHFLSHDSTNY